MNKILNFVDLLAETSTSGSNTNNGSSVWVYVVMIALVVLMLVLPTITQRKRNKEYTEMLNSLNVGDTIKTIGGVIGRVTKITEKDGQKSFILETGAKGNKTTMEFDIASVAYIVSSTAKKTEEPKVEAKQEEQPEVAPAESETAPAAPAEEVMEEKKTPSKKTTAKKSTNKKSSNKKA